MTRKLAITGFKLLASVPLGMLLGAAAAHVIEAGLWPLLLIPEAWLNTVDIALMIPAQIIAIGAAIWFWALDRA